MKQLVKRIVKKGISWYVDPLYREIEKLRQEIKSLYAMLDEATARENEGLRKDIQNLYTILNGTGTESVHGGGTFAHDIVPPDGTRVWIYRAGETGRFAARYLKEYTGAKLAGLIDDAIAATQPVYQGNNVLMLAEATEKIGGNDWVLFCGDGQANSFTYRELQGTLRMRGVTARVLHIWDLDMRPMFRRLTPEGYESRFISRLCTYQDFQDPVFMEHVQKLCGAPIINRKSWEWAYILRVLESFGCLRPGLKGLGFAVGTEPLPSYFASMDVNVLATDLDPGEMAAQSWIQGNQHSGGNTDALFKGELCAKEKFENNVSFRYVDMNSIPEDLQGYDFCWSSCAIEHVGSLRQSKQFLKNMLRCLKPGGVAVHTTELNLTSDVDTVETGNSVLFRKKDIEEIKQYFLSLGCEMETSYLRSDADEDNQLDIFPFFSPEAPLHINLIINGYASTSFAIVVRKPF